METVVLKRVQRFYHDPEEQDITIQAEVTNQEWNSGVRLGEIVLNGHTIHVGMNVANGETVFSGYPKPYMDELGFV